MENAIALIEGEIYYLVGFHDVKFQEPSITTLVYQGLDSEGKYGHLFLRAGGGGYLSFAKGEINSIVDKLHLITWLQRAHSPQTHGQEYRYETNQQL